MCLVKKKETQEIKKINASWNLFGLRGTLEKYMYQIKKKPFTPKTSSYSKLGNAYDVWIVIYYHTY